jgi:RHS repeat-associated protein
MECSHERRINSSYATPTNLGYTYNVDGTVHTMSDATGTTTYGYDALGDVTSQALAASGGSGFANTTTSYAYFTTGALSTLTYPAYAGSSDPAVGYAYNSTGELISSTDWLSNVVTYAYDADGNQTSQDNNVSTGNPSGTSSTAFGYDAADNNSYAVSTINQVCGGSETLTQWFAGGAYGLRNADGQLTYYYTHYAGSCSGQSDIERNYSYDQAGDLIFQGASGQGSSPNNFAYDASGDPTTISSHDGSGSFDTYSQTFDAAGEDTGQSPISGSSGVSSTYTYDTLGDQIKDVSTTTDTYGFNATGQMSSVTTPSGTVNYLYDGDGVEAGTSTTGTATSQWTDPTDIDSTRAIDAETCTTATFCVAVGASGYATTYNGTTWSTPVDADSTRTMDAVSCTSSTFCVAVDTSGDATDFNGTTWSTPVDIDSTRSVNAVSCVSTTFCVAVGASGYAAIYTGTWATSSDIDSTRTMDALSCTSSTFCEAVDTSGDATKYTGSWAASTDIDSTRSVNTISCTSSTFCVAAGASGYAAVYTGTWAASSDVDSTRAIKDVACPSTTLCLAVDSSGYSTTYNGTSWSTPTDIDGSNALTALSCASSTNCAAVDADGNALTYTGSWSSAISVDATRSVSAISCPTATFCITGDSSGYAAVYEVATQAWAAPVDVDSTRAIDAETCSSTTFCVAVGASGYATTYNGTNWSTPVDADSTRTMDAVSCVSSVFCVAVDASGDATIYNGSSWSTPTDIDSTRSVNAVSCVSSTFCVAVGASGYAAIYTGTWATSSDVDSARSMDALSCTSSTFCEAVDTSGDVTKYTGSWATSTDIDSTRSVNTISCTSSTFCVAAGASGYAAVYTGSWAASSDVDSTRTIKVVACLTTTFCEAIDSSGDATKYTGSWTTSSDVDGSNALTALSCVSTTFCDAADANGNVLTYTGTWSVATDIDATRSASGITCPTTTFCVTGDGSGYSATYKPVIVPPLVAQLTLDTDGSLALILGDGSYYYVYGPGSIPVEQVSLSTSTPAYLTYVRSNSTWITSNDAGDQTAFYGYDAFGNQAFGTPTSSFGFAGQYTDKTSGYSNMRARLYNSQTGSFMTRDPAFEKTDTAYSYATDDPVDRTDPTGRDTVGICGNLSAQISFIGGFGGTGTLCLVRTVFTPGGNDDIGITETAGAAPLGLGASVGGSLEFQVSNANHLQDLAHRFWNAIANVSLTPGFGFGVTAGTFWGKGSSNQKIYGAQGGFGLGGGYGGYLYETNTWVQQVNGVVQANILRLLWDALVPPPLTIASNLDMILSKSKSQIKNGIDTTKPFRSGADTAIQTEENR